MFNWIRRMWDGAYGAIDNTVRSWVRDLLNGLYGFLHMVFGDVGTAWDAIVRTAEDGWRRSEEFAQSVALAIWHILRVAIPSVIREFSKLFRQIESYAKGVYWYVVREVRYVVDLIGSSVNALWRQVLKDVWNPLYKAFTQAWHWITNEGATVLYYITHPAKLIDLVWISLLAKIEHEAWVAGDLLGKFFLSLIIRNLQRFVSLLEDIIDAVL